jgi:large subunit ribosomal protein L25
MFNLDYKIRNLSESNDGLRKKGLVPAVFYGKKQASTPIVVSMVDFTKVFGKAGESAVVSIKGDVGSFDTLIHDVSYDPVKGNPIHVDFYVFEKGKKIDVSVPLALSGVAPAVKDLGGNLVKVLHEIEVKSSPESIPHEIMVDISSLKTFEDKILAKDIRLPSSVELVTNPDEVVLAVEGPKGDEPEESTPVDLSAIEVVKKGKKEEEAVEATS